MTAGDIFWFIILVAMVIVVYVFIFKGRNYGYMALAARIDELLNNGTPRVWLLYGDKGVGILPSVPVSRGGSVWSFLNVGALGYIKNNKLTIEYTWWKNTRPLAVFSPSDIKIYSSSIVFNRKNYPAISIGGQQYVVLGFNIRGADVIKRQVMSLGSGSFTEELLGDFESELNDAGFIITPTP